MTSFIDPGDTVTVTIGRNVPADSQWALFGNGDPVRPMTAKGWDTFRSSLVDALGAYLSPRALFVYQGEGEWDGGTEDSVCIVALCDLERRVDPLHEILSQFARAYDQEAIGCAVGQGVLVSAVGDHSYAVEGS
jgi:hypothetical protein